MKNKKVLISAHIIFWLMGAGVESLWLDFGSLSGVLTTMVWLVFASFPSRAIPFYLNYFIWVPRWLLNKNLWLIPLWLVVSSSIFFVSFLCINWGFQYYLLGEASDMGGWIVSAFENLFIVLGVSTGLRLASNWVENLDVLQELELKKTQTEIEAIRVNVNFPYVLGFLENLKTQAMKDPQSIQGPLLDFSDNLRKQLYGKMEERVQVQSTERRTDSSLIK